MDRARAAGCVGNNFVQNQQTKKNRQDHLDRLEKIMARKIGTSTTIDNSPPVLIKAISEDPRKKSLKLFTNVITERENKVLLQRISAILTTPAKNAEKDYQEMKKIVVSRCGGNVRLYDKYMNKKRTQQFFINLRKQKSYYKAKTWEDEYKIQKSNQRFMREVKYERPPDFVDPFSSASADSLAPGFAPGFTAIVGIAAAALPNVSSCTDDGGCRTSPCSRQHRHKQLSPLRRFDDSDGNGCQVTNSTSVGIESNHQRNSSSASHIDRIRAVKSERQKTTPTSGSSINLSPIASSDKRNSNSSDSGNLTASLNNNNNRMKLNDHNCNSIGSNSQRSRVDSYSTVDSNSTSKRQQQQHRNKSSSSNSVGRGNSVMASNSTVRSIKQRGDSSGIGAGSSSYYDGDGFESATADENSNNFIINGSSSSTVRSIHINNNSPTKKNKSNNSYRATKSDDIMYTAGGDDNVYQDDEYEDAGGSYAALTNSIHSSLQEKSSSYYSNNDLTDDEGSSRNNNNNNNGGIGHETDRSEGYNSNYENYKINNGTTTEAEEKKELLAEVRRPIRITEEREQYHNSSSSNINSECNSDIADNANNNIDSSNGISSVVSGEEIEHHHLQQQQMLPKLVIYQATSVVRCWLVNQEVVVLSAMVSVRAASAAFELANNDTATTVPPPPPTTGSSPISGASPSSSNNSKIINNKSQRRKNSYNRNSSLSPSSASAVARKSSKQKRKVFEAEAEISLEDLAVLRGEEPSLLTNSQQQLQHGRVEQPQFDCNAQEFKVNSGSNIPSSSSSSSVAVTSIIDHSLLQQLAAQMVEHVELRIDIQSGPRLVLNLVGNSNSEEEEELRGRKTTLQRSGTGTSSDSEGGSTAMTTLLMSAGAGGSGGPELNSQQYSNNFSYLDNSSLYNEEELADMFVDDSKAALLVRGLQVPVCFNNNAPGSSSSNKLSFLLDATKIPIRPENIYVLLKAVCTDDDQMAVTVHVMTNSVYQFKRNVRPAVVKGTTLRLSTALPSVIQADPDLMMTFASNLADNIRIIHSTRTGKNILTIEEKSI